MSYTDVPDEIRIAGLASSADGFFTDSTTGQSLNDNKTRAVKAQLLFEPSENLTVVDGIEVASLNHFAAQGTSGGPISMLNTDVVQSATLLAGGFPALYGLQDQVMAFFSKHADFIVCFAPVGK